MESTAVVEELMLLPSDWVNTAEIIRTTFSALTSIVKTHSSTIHELRRQLNTKVSHQDLHTSLSQKANTLDTQQSISLLQEQINLPNAEIQSILNEKVSLSNLHYLLGNKASLDEVRALLDNKRSKWDYETELRELEKKIEDAASKAHSDLK